VLGVSLHIGNAQDLTARIKTMANEEYLAKLKDPRWQKKRLEVFERDEWTCQSCFNRKSTLVIHHKLYLTHKNPWDYPDELLITLCEDCHQSETLNIPTVESNIMYQLKSKFLSWGLHELYDGFYKLELLHNQDIVAGAYGLALANADIQKLLLEHFHKQTAADAKEIRKQERNKVVK
jgi:hypothetical protein